MEGIQGCAALIVLMSHLTVMYYPAAYWGEELSHSEQYLDIFIGQSPISILLPLRHYMYIGGILYPFPIESPVG